MLNAFYWSISQAIMYTKKHRLATLKD